jgi:hypothetical protein
MSKVSGLPERIRCLVGYRKTLASVPHQYHCLTTHIGVDEEAVGLHVKGPRAKIKRSSI